MKCLPKCYKEAHLRRSHITSSIFHSSLYLYSSWKTFSLQTLLIHIGQTQSFNPSYAVQIFWLYRTEQTLFRKMPINHFQNKHVALTVRHHHHRSRYFAYTYGASIARELILLRCVYKFDLFSSDLSTLCSSHVKLVFHFNGKLKNDLLRKRTQVGDKGSNKLWFMIMRTPWQSTWFLLRFLVALERYNEVLSGYWSGACGSW